MKSPAAPRLWLDGRSADRQKTLMPKWPIWALASVVVLTAAAAGGVRYWRGPIGPSTLQGGTIEAALLPEFASLDANRWLNGVPASLASARGEVVFIESWAPA